MTPVRVRGGVRLQLGFTPGHSPNRMGCILDTRILQLPHIFVFYSLLGGRQYGGMQRRQCPGFSLGIVALQNEHRFKGLVEFSQVLLFKGADFSLQTFLVDNPQLEGEQD